MAHYILGVLGEMLRSPQASISFATSGTIMIQIRYRTRTISPPSPSSDTHIDTLCEYWVLNAMCVVYVRLSKMTFFTRVVQDKCYQEECQS